MVDTLVEVSKNVFFIGEGGAVQTVKDNML